ncbi:MAG: hypothetical protein EOM88_01280 [Clostridia bacterium]|nr:hypothetical protein [Clostridia bacterium]
MKRIIVSVVVLLFLIFGIFLLINQPHKTNIDQLVLEQTKNISQDYLALRYQTDNVLINAKDYLSYNDWHAEMSNLITKWEKLSADSLILEKNSAAMTDEKISFRIVNNALAYDNQEISNVFDRAPAGKKIETLAKYLGVDAKMAYRILKNDQAQVEADAWNQAGDTFQKLENSAILIKDTAKVAGFVGTFALTGGSAAFATSGTLSQAAVLVSGADLVLEISDDSAKIILGNYNKISVVVSDVRIVTEPLSSLLMVTDLPNNLVKGIEKINAVSFGLDQFNSVIQEGKVIGLKIPAYTQKVNQSAQVAVLEKDEVNQWLLDQKMITNTMSVEELEDILGLDLAEELEKNEELFEDKELEELGKEQVDSNLIDSEIVGNWKGILKYTSSQSSPEEQLNYEFKLNNDGTVSSDMDGHGFSVWKKEGDRVRLFLEDDETEEGDAFFEFAISNKTLTFIRLSDLSSTEEGLGTFAGEDFFGGKFYQITLTKL